MNGRSHALWRLGWAKLLAKKQESNFPGFDHDGSMLHDEIDLLDPENGLQWADARCNHVQSGPPSSNLVLKATLESDKDQ